uniref:Fatty acid hydroxylase domain-containing protein n=1 Tax=Aureoumbra lagunensis TaxID=44058 RepID=A0A7S3NQ20_9STRA
MQFPAKKSKGPHYYEILTNEKLELSILIGLWILVWFKGNDWNVSKSSFSFKDVVSLMTVGAVVRKFYNDWLEFAYDNFPEKRTQPMKTNREERDVTGRDLDELREIEQHDRITMLVKFFLDISFYFTIGKVLYPQFTFVDKLVVNKFIGMGTSSVLALIAHHYTLSFGMYFMHRYLHVNKYLWEKIHSKHHYAKTPLARTTYMDHWLDNIINALIAEYCTQLLIPLPKVLLFASRIFRILESLEKHSGMSGPINIVHTLQRIFPYAQQPHHHDWHHEGFKGSNYTFSSIGGLWDALFLTRHPGRSDKQATVAATSYDYRQNASGGSKGGKSAYKQLNAIFDRACPLVLTAFFSAAVAKAYAAS